MLSRMWLICVGPPMALTTESNRVRTLMPAIGAPKAFLPVAFITTAEALGSFSLYDSQSQTSSAVNAGVPMLLEKPVSDDVESAMGLVDAAEQAGVPILVGHHRRHSPLI